jgi:hypothetical protein
LYLASSINIVIHVDNDVNVIDRESSIRVSLTIINDCGYRSKIDFKVIMDKDIIMICQYMFVISGRIISLSVI